MQTSSAAASAAATWTVISWEERQPINLTPGSLVPNFHPNWATCQKCGQGIKYVVTLKSSTGVLLQVGQDCAVTLEGGPDLAAIRRAEREANHLDWLASDEGRAHAEEVRNGEARRAAIGARNADRYSLWIAGLRLVIACDKASRWTRDMAKATVQSWESGHRSAPLSMVEERTFLAAMRDVNLPASTYAGEIKARLTMDVWFEYRTHFVGSAYNGAEVVKYIWNLRDAEGRQYVWITEAWLGDLHKDADRGVRLKVKATVKSHKEFRDVKQTGLSRVTVLETEGGDRAARRLADGYVEDREAR